MGHPISGPGSARQRAVSSFSAEPLHYIPLGERVTLSIPLTGAWSKNAQHGMGSGRLYLRDAARAHRETVGWELKAALKGRVFRPRRKVWLDLFVQRANLKSDPINVLDGVADAVKDMVGLDDRWFAVWRLDWALVRKEDPWLQLQLWQDAAIA